MVSTSKFLSVNRPANLCDKNNEEFSKDRIKEPEGLLRGVHFKVLVSEQASKPVTRIMKSLVRTGLRSLLRGVHLKVLVSEQASKPVTRIMKSLVRAGLRSLLRGVHLKVLVSEQASKPVTRIMKSLVRTG